MSWARNNVGERGDNIGLPDVTTADNGKIMEVESGEWKLKEGSSGGGLPEITEADEGKFLGVVSGEAAWATAGSDALILTVDDWDAAIPTISQSWNDIAAALANNKPVYAYYSVYDNGNITESGIYMVTSAVIDEKYIIYVNFDNNSVFAQADTSDGPLEIIYF